MGETIGNIRAQAANLEEITNIQKEEENAQVAAFDDTLTEGNPLAALGKFALTLLQRSADAKKASKSDVTGEQKPLTRKQAEDAAEKFKSEHKLEISTKDLLALLERLQPNDPVETIRKKVFDQFPTLKDAKIALDFLAQEKDGKGVVTGGTLHTNVLAARDSLLAPLKEIGPNDSSETILNKLEAFYPYATLVRDVLNILAEQKKGDPEQLDLAHKSLEINKGRELKLMPVSAYFATALEKVGIDMTPGAFQTRYNDILKNPPGLEALLKGELQGMSALQKKAYLEALLRLAGQDSKLEGSHGDHAKLKTICDQIRQMQAVIQVDKESTKTFNEVCRLAAQDGITLPPQLSPDALSTAVLDLVFERYPSPEKVGLMATKFGFKT